MEKYAELISIMLQHSQRFLDFWNYQIVISLAAFGFIFSSPAVISKRSIRMFITAIFLMVAIITVFFLSIHQRREEKMYAAIQSHIVAAPADFTKADIEYIDSLKPTAFGGKAGVIVLADLLIVATVWVSPKIKE